MSAAPEFRVTVSDGQMTRSWAMEFSGKEQLEQHLKAEGWSIVEVVELPAPLAGGAHLSSRSVDQRADYSGTYGGENFGLYPKSCGPVGMDAGAGGDGGGGGGGDGGG